MTARASLPVLTGAVVALVVNQARLWQRLRRIESYQISTSLDHHTRLNRMEARQPTLRSTRRPTPWQSVPAH